MRWTAITTAGLLLACFGLAEWAFLGPGVVDSPDSLALGWLWSVGLYGLLGSAIGLACALVFRDSVRAGEATAAGCMVTLLAATHDWFYSLWPSSGSVLLEVAAGMLVAWIVFVAARGRPHWLGAGRWAALLTLLAAGCLAITGIVWGSALWIAAGVLAAVLALSKRIGRSHDPRAAIIAPTVAVALLGYFAIPPRADSLIRADRDGPSILLVTIDTLRADRVGAYGYRAARTPNLDKLAREGLFYEHAFSHSPFTGPSHLTILSGRTPLEHGVISNGMRAPSDISTLADRLGAAGWTTAGYVSGYPITDDLLGVGSQFDRFDDELRLFDWIPAKLSTVAALPGLIDIRINRALGQSHREPIYRPAARVTAAACEYLRNEARRPFFLWVHYFDPHSPYRPPKKYWSKGMLDFHGPGADGRWYSVGQNRAAIESNLASRKHFKNLYDAEVAYVDEQLGALLAQARVSSPDGDLLIVVTADHGEDFGEHGGLISRDLYDTTLHVPLIVVPPPSSGRAPEVIAEQTGLKQVAPLILEYAGVEERSIARELESVAPRADAAGGLMAIGLGPGKESVSYSLRTPEWKLIHRTTAGDPARRELYDLQRDPVELENLASREPDVVQTLFNRLEPALALGVRESPKLTPRQIETLRGLGYLQ